MKLRHLLFIVFLFLTLRAAAQPSEEIYLGNTARSGYSNDGFYGPFNIGFSFTFFNNPYSQFYISPNGLVTFGSGQDSPSNVKIPSASLPNNFIAPFWDDLVVDPFGNVLYKTIGAAPNRKLIVQFRNMAFYTTPPYLGTFSVILYESGNRIQIQYRMIVLKDNPRATGNSATIGIENADGSAGVQYSYEEAGSVSTSKAITFTPSGDTYTTDADAMYFGVYLTTNLTLPEPQITDLYSPTDGAVVGVDNTFQWSASTDAAVYALQIATNPDLVSATSYNAGSALSYTLNGLDPDATYYWTVFTSNATGFTWSAVKSFTTSLNPPLMPVPRTIWTEQNLDKAVRLQYTGGDATPKTAIVTSLPPQGALYQYYAGQRGNRITAVPATVTDANHNVIYAATGSTGNGVGNFTFKINDANGDSPDGTITVNVAPPAVPNVLYTAKKPGVEIQFDIPMADATGKESQFTVTVNGTQATISSANLKPGDPTTIVLNLVTPLTGSETVLVSYTQGDVTGATGGFLLSFTDQAVTLLAQTITFPEIPLKATGDPPFNPGATSGSGLGLTYSSSDLSVATVTGSNVTILSAGIADIMARQAGNATYAPARYTRTMIVNNPNKENQTITFDPLPEKTYGDADFALTASASSGLPVTYTSENPSAATIAGDQVHITGAGTTIITAFQPGDDNFNPAVPVQQLLTVNKLEETITFTGVPEKLLFGDTFTLSATSSAGVTVLFESLDVTKATVSGNILTAVAKGEVQIRAYYPGDLNILPAEAFATVEIYTTHRDIMHLFTPNNDGFNDYWELPDLATWGKCDVKVYNRWGKMVFSDPDYNNLWDGRSNGNPLPEGAYYFIIKTENAGTQKGTVNIVR
jgi:gliding motility-associated-like protein